MGYPLVGDHRRAVGEAVRPRADAIHRERMSCKHWSAVAARRGFIAVYILTMQPNNDSPQGHEAQDMMSLIGSTRGRLDRRRAACSTNTPWAELRKLLPEFPDEVTANPAFQLALAADPGVLGSICEAGLSLLATRAATAGMVARLRSLPKEIAEFIAFRDGLGISASPPASFWGVHAGGESAEELQLGKALSKACQLLQSLGTKEVEWTHSAEWEIGISESDFSEQGDAAEDEDEDEDANGYDEMFNEPEERLMSKESRFVIDGRNVRVPHTASGEFGQFGDWTTALLLPPVPASPGRVSLRVDIVNGRAHFTCKGRSFVTGIEALTFDEHNPTRSDQSVLITFAESGASPELTALEQELAARFPVPTLVLVQLPNASAALCSAGSGQWRNIKAKLLELVPIFWSAAQCRDPEKELEHLRAALEPHDFHVQIVDSESMQKIWWHANSAAKEACFTGQVDGRKALRWLMSDCNDATIIAMSDGKITYLRPFEGDHIEVDGRSFEVELQRFD